MLSEPQLIHYLKKRIRPKSSSILGIGDDAAVFKGFGKKRIVFSTDAIVEGVDFQYRKSRAQDVGRKALAVNLSDMAAMGARPRFFVVTLGMPKRIPERWVKNFYEGVLRLAKKHKVQCVGGDLSASKSLFASIGILGEVDSQKVLTRRGAKPGDLIGVTGVLGGSIKKHHFSFEPRVQEAQMLKRYASAMIDLSDGFSQDLGHLLRASKVKATIELNHIPVSNAAKKMAKQKTKDSLARALCDGEDFELLFTVPVKRAPALRAAWRKAYPKVKLSWVGKVHRGMPAIDWRRGGKRVQVSKKFQKGYQHFS